MDTDYYLFCSNKPWLEHKNYMFLRCSMCGSEKKEDSTLIVTNDASHANRREEPVRIFTDLTVFSDCLYENMFEETALCIPVQDVPLLTSDTLRNAKVLSSVCAMCQRVIEVSAALGDIEINYALSNYRIYIPWSSFNSSTSGGRYKFNTVSSSSTVNLS